jgi:hypothetical protein
LWWLNVREIIQEQIKIEQVKGTFYCMVFDLKSRVNNCISRSLFWFEVEVFEEVYFRFDFPGLDNVYFKNYFANELIRWVVF